MRLLKTMHSDIQDLIGFQEYDQESDYVESIYNLKVEVDDGILLYNHFTKVIVLLNNLEELIPNELLVSNQFFLKSDVNQNDFLNRTFQEYRDQHYENYLDPHNIVVLNTYRCNANCAYCFEKNRDHSKTMSEKTALDLAKWICSHVKHDFNLQFFGGEPTVNIKAIDTITQYLNKHFQYQYHTDMTSNGYLLSGITSEHMLYDQKLKRATITLDGINNTYNKVKNYNYTDTDAFSVVIAVIEKLLFSGIEVQINCNVSPTNYQEIHCVINYILTKFKDFSCNFVIHPLFETDDMKFTDDEINKMVDNYLMLVQELHERSNYSFNDFDNLKFFHCVADSGKGITITPTGDISICENDGENSIIGSIYKDTILNTEPIKRYRTVQEQDKCSTCVLKPTCIFLKGCEGSSNQCTENRIDYRVKCLKEKVKDWYYKSLTY